MSTPAPHDLDRDLAAFFAQGLAAPGDDATFNDLALRVFAWQVEALAPYRALCQRRGVMPGRLRHWSEIPPVPVQAFKDLRLQCNEGADAGADAETGTVRVFRTSGTTPGHRPGEHYMTPAALALYDASLLPTFRSFVLPELEPAGEGARTDLLPLVLGPPTATVPHSSLWHMVGVVAERLFGTPPAFFMEAAGAQLDAAGLVQALQRAEGTGRGVCLFATDIALDRFLDSCAALGVRIALPHGSRILHTGGSKGLRRVIDVAALYTRVEATLGIPAAWVVNEYGMTEMASQYYDDTLRRAAGGDSATVVEPPPRLKHGPPWVRALVVDVQTLDPLPPGRPGLLRVVDLANRGSAVALLTEDRAVAVDPDASPEGGADAAGGVMGTLAVQRPRALPFRLLGRARGSELRGCSLEAEVPAQ